MPKLTPRSAKYGNGTLLKSKDGRHFFASIYLAGGERRRGRFKSEAAAKLWLDSQAAEYRPLSQAQMLDASRAYAMLPDDVTLLDCAKFWHDSKHATSPIAFSDAAEKWIASKRVSLRDVTVAWYENALDTFDGLIPDVQSVGDLDAPRIEKALAGMKPSVRNAQLRVLSAFFGWAVKSGYAVRNHVEDIDKSRISKPKRSVLTVAEAEKMLRHAEARYPEIVPYLAVGMFAGIRPHEMRKLKADDFKHGYIYLGPDVAKTSSERTVQIRPNLAAWLAAFHVSDGVYPKSSITLTRTLRKLFQHADVVDVKDIMRHSFASYAYEQSGDAAKTASELGHTDTAMLFSHYRGVVPPKSGAKFFAIRPLPKTCPKNAL